MREKKKKKKKKGKKKRKNRKTKEENPVMNAGCSRFNESPRWSSTGNKESIEAKDLGSAEVLAKWKRETERKRKERKKRVKERRRRGRGQREREYHLLRGEPGFQR